MFSEPIDPGYTSLDLLDGTGEAILVGAGAADPADPRTLVAPIPAGSAAPVGQPLHGQLASPVGRGRAHDRRLPHVRDRERAVDTGGHGASGSAPMGSGALHGGHPAERRPPRSRARCLRYGGSMLAFGLAILAWLVLRPALGRIPRGDGLRLRASRSCSDAAGCLLLVVVAPNSLPELGESRRDRLRPVRDRVAGRSAARGAGRRRSRRRDRRPARRQVRAACRGPSVARSPSAARSDWSASS